MIKCICYKTYNGWKDSHSNWFVYESKNKTNFCIEQGTIVFINLDESGYTDVYKDDGEPLCYINSNYKEHFIELVEWREKQIKTVLDD